MQQTIRSVWRSFPLLVVLGAAVLVVLYYFSIPEPRHDWTAAATPTPGKTSPVEPPVALTTNADEPATNVGAVVLPDFLQTCVNQVRKQGKNPWWADAIETAWTRGFPAAVEVLRASVPPEQLDEKVANLLSLIAQEKLEFLIEGLPMIHGATSPFTVASGPINHWARKDPMRLVDFALEDRKSVV